MGLVHPVDLDAWRRWQETASPVRRLKRALRGPGAAPELTLVVRGDAPRILVAVDATTPSAIASVLRPFAGDATLPLALLSHAGAPILDGLEGAWVAHELPLDGSAPDVLRQVRAIVGLGAYLAAGARAAAWAPALDARFVVVQHGLLTPLAPPLPANVHVLAFSERDAEFWRSGRDDVTSEVVGSQLLWDAAQAPRHPIRDDRPVFLGQLHGAELPRVDLARTARSACRATGAVYRPHPAEIDKLSRAQHALWQRAGISIDRRPLPLAELRQPVLSTFSTGVLEQAARGLPAWAVFDGTAPDWLADFWDRYGMRRADARARLRLDGEATPAPQQPASEPVRAVLAAARRMGGLA